jgi:hypothetical protein
LMQSHSSESQRLPVQAPTLVNASAPAVEEPPAASAMNGTPSLNGAPPAVQTRPATIPYAPIPAAKTNGIAKPQPPPVEVKKAVSLPAASQPATAQAGAPQPPIAKAAAVQKPAPAELQFALVAAPNSSTRSLPAPDRPRRQPHILPLSCRRAGPSRGRAVSKSQIRSRARRSTNWICGKCRGRHQSCSDLRIVPPESLETESRPSPLR